MSATEELTCDELVEVVTQYLEGTMRPGERDVFDEHLYICAGCRIYLDQMRQTIRTLGTLRPEEIAPETREDLHYLFRDWKRGEGRA